MVITGSILPSAILFSVCVFIFNSEILSIYLIALFAMFGSHLGDLGGFFCRKNNWTKYFKNEIF
jgi:membrane-associated protein